MAVTLLLGDCKDVMAAMHAESVDSIVTDPPYGLSFMGKDWDHGVPGVAFWEAALRVAKPGAHLLAFGGTRTFHRLACAIDDAGWEIRDVVMWVYGSGFPKSHNVSKAIDKAAGAEREVVGRSEYASRRPNPMSGTAYNYNAQGYDISANLDITAPATPDAIRWDGWGTAAKPAFEPVIVARKPVDTDTEPYTIVGNLLRLEAQLWLLSHASNADGSLVSSPSGYAEACATARWSADEPRSIRGALCAQMGTSQFEWATTTTLNTVSSWLAIWDEALRRGSTFTIATATSQIIDLRTLSCSASALTPHAIIQAATNQPGSWWSVLPAASVLHVAATRLNATLELIAVESAIESGHMPRPDAIDPTVLAKPVIVARKPLIGTVAANVLEYGTWAMNIDGCRIKASDLTGQRPSDTLPAGGASWVQDGSLCDSCAETVAASSRRTARARKASTAPRSAEPTLSERGEISPAATDRTDTGCCAGQSRGELDADPTDALSLSMFASGERPMAISPRATASITSTATDTTTASRTCNLCGREITGGCTAPSMPVTPNGKQSTPSGQENAASAGRWPSNLIHDGSDEVTGLMPNARAGTAVRHNGGGNTFGGDHRKPPMDDMGYGDSGSAARFFYCAKASRADRDEGLEGMDERPTQTAVGMALVTSKNWGDDGEKVYVRNTVARNHHPTVKPTDLMRYLCRLVTPPGGTVLDPFMGSGSTGKAAVLEGFSFTGIEIDEEYLEIARRRIEHAAAQPRQDELL